MKLFVTQPSMPPIDEFYRSLQSIWDSKSLTNGGQYHSDFEEKLARYLEVDHLSLFSNGTLALITALQALEIKGEVITTPYSFVATTHSLWWNGISPIFVDINPLSMNIDPEKIERAITQETTAIMPVHVYGNPCEMDKIQKIADKYNLKVIYDAAHAFGIKENDSSILKYGDLSILSFHATKVFNTIEGGAIISHDPATKLKIDQLKNFGFVDETTVVSPGINAKMNEIQSAYGLLQLNYVNKSISERKRVHDMYVNAFSGLEGLTIPNLNLQSTSNYSYFPVLIEPEFGKSRDEVYMKLKEFEIFSRRYFYPLISQFPPYNELPSADLKNLPFAQLISEKILCLPIYEDLSLESVSFIIEKVISIKAEK